MSLLLGLLYALGVVVLVRLGARRGAADTGELRGRRPVTAARADVAGERLRLLDRHVRIAGQRTQVVGRVADYPAGRPRREAPVPGQRDLVHHTPVAQPQRPDALGHLGPRLDVRALGRDRHPAAVLDAVAPGRLLERPRQPAANLVQAVHHVSLAIEPDGGEAGGQRDHMGGLVAPALSWDNHFEGAEHLTPKSCAFPTAS